MPKRTRYLFINDADLFTEEQINLLKEIDDDSSYTDPLSPEGNPKYKTSLERFINRALSSQCTMQDILNLGVLAAKMKKIHSKGKVTELGVDFYSQLSSFCNEITGFTGDYEKYSFQYIKAPGFFKEQPGYKAKSSTSLSPNGYVMLSDEQKQQLLSFREKLINTKQYSEGFGDAGLIRNEYETFKYEAGKALNVSIKEPAHEDAFIDRKDISISNTSFYALNNPTTHAAPKARNKQVTTDQITRLRADKLTASDNKIVEMKNAWDAMRSHTPHISFFNSTEFNNMEKAYKAYISAYDNLKSGMTIDGKNYRAQKDYIEKDDLTKLKKLQDDMQKAARAYTAAKRTQKGGGIDKHSTKQGADRLAMAHILSKFNVFPEPAKVQPAKITGTADIGNTNNIDDLMKKANAIENAVYAKKDKVRPVKLSEIDKKPKSGRKKLDEHIRHLEKKEAAKQENKAKKPPKL